MMESVDRSGKPEPGSMAESRRKTIPEDALRYYRGLVGQIEIALPRQASRVLLFTSSMQGEGTTEIATGVSLTLAAAMGRPTALVDCNVHTPDIHRRFGVEDVGLYEYLRGRIDLEHALLNTLVPNLHIMPLGAGLTSLAGIDKDQFGEFIAAMRSRFEYVVLDSAAVGLSPETTILCDMTDAVVLVVGYGSTRREVVRKTKEMIERAGGRVLGAVLNKRKFPIPEFLYRRL